MKQTANYQLNQWEGTDRVSRADFNADNAKIDAAIKAAADSGANIACSSYTGDGEALRTINLGFTPRAVLVCNRSGAMYLRATGGTGATVHYLYGGLAINGYPVVANQNTGVTPALEIVDGGFRVAYGVAVGSMSNYTNYDGTIYHYVAIG